MKKYFILGIFFLLVSSSCEQILMEDDISDKTVILTAPYDNVMFTSTSINFNWEVVEDADQYRLQIAKPNFANPQEIVVDVLLDTNSSTQQINIGNYEWRVKAINSSYETSYSKRNFSVASNDDFQSNTIVITSPANNLITKTPLQSLSWQPIIGATTYQIQIFDSTNTLILDQNSTSSTYNYTFGEGTYQWKVRAGNGLQNTLYSSHSILVDFTAPNSPTLISPVNLGTVATSDVSFQWSRTPILGSVEKDSIYIYTNSALTNLQSKNSATSPYTANLNSGTYYWKVKSFDEAGNSGNPSSVFSFTIN